MSKVINLSGKFSEEKPQIQIGDKLYDVNDGMGVVLQFEELIGEGTAEKMVEAISKTIGKEAAEELKIMEMSMENFKILSAGLMAAMQDLEFEEVYKRFQNNK